jgi:predicted alpha/beta hydrolase
MKDHFIFNEHTGVINLNYWVPTKDSKFISTSLYYLPNTVLSTDSANIKIPVFNDNSLLIICSAMGVMKSRYIPLANFLARKGWLVVIFEYRGIGESKKYADSNSNILDWAKHDIQGIINWCNLTIAPKNIYLLGHSIGGQLFGFLDDYKDIKGIITIASQKGYWRLWSTKMQLAMLATWKFFQFYLIFFKSLSFMSLLKLSPLPKGIALDWCRWGLSEEFFSRDNKKLDFEFSRYKGPLLMVSIEDDFLYAPKKSVDCLANKFCNANLTRFHLHPSQFGVKKLGHSGVFKNIKACESFWQDVLSWIESSNK